MTEQDVLKLIETGECIKIEFKESKTSATKDVYHTICAFLNRIGGYMNPDTLIQYSKNPKIARVFREIGRADELGSGLRNLFSFVPIFDNIFLNRQQIRTLEKLRDTLLPKLMSGEVRVKF